MGQDETSADDRMKLMAAARARVAGGDAKFSNAALCAETGVTRETFRAHFQGKAALMAALVAPEPDPNPKAAPSEPGVSTPDAWLERRLRVFERALTALEAKADLMAQAHALAIARLEEKLALPAPAPEAVAVPEPQAVAKPEPELAAEPAPDFLPPERAPLAAISREEMTEVLQTARTKVAVAPEAPVVDRNFRLRWLTIGALSLVVLLFCVGLTLGDTAGAQVAGQGIAHRQAKAGTARLMALADFGDANAQAQLAYAYLRGGDTASAARWSAAASQSGQPVGQYLAGALSGDKARAFALFKTAAGQGNLKAMHNLAIAYAQGEGTVKDEGKAAEWFARAAERGYVDSAFDLAVLYERGLGVGQDLRQALKWYGIAALAGDAPAKERAAFLHTQMKPDEARLADAAARSFAPLPVRGFANSL
jgi:hypothetical protein